MLVLIFSFLAVDILPSMPIRWILNSITVWAFKELPILKRNASICRCWRWRYCYQIASLFMYMYSSCCGRGLRAVRTRVGYTAFIPFILLRSFIRTSFCFDVSSNGFYLLRKLKASLVCFVFLNRRLLYLIVLTFIVFNTGLVLSPIL